MATTNLGMWTLRLGAAAVVLYVLGTIAANGWYAGQAGGNSLAEDLELRPTVALMMLAATTCGILTFVAGAVAILRQRERSPWVFAATVIGGLFLIMLAGELAFAH